MRLLIVSEMAAVREGLRTLLSDEPDIEAVGEARSGVEALIRIAETRFDVLLIDIDPPGDDGLRAIPHIRSSASPPGIVAISLYADRALRRRALAAGADRFVDKSRLPADVMAALRAASAAGANFARPAASARMPAAASSTARGDDTAPGESLMSLYNQVLNRFEKSFGEQPPAFIVRSPGRVNLLGEHVDYNDGWVLPAAIDRAVYLAVGRCESPLASIAAMDLNEGAAFRVTETAEKQDAAGKPLPGWALYPAGVAHMLHGAGLAVSGMDAVFASDVPRGAGLSSSAAVELAFAVAWRALGGWQKTGMELALLCQKAENQYVGVNCGIMDQFACANGKAGHALLLDCRTLDWQPVPLPGGVAIVIADTMKRRELGKSEYNNRRAACEEATRTLAAVLPGIRALRDVSLADFNKYAHLLDPIVARRARHVVEECERTVAAVESLKRNDLAAFGQAMNNSHRTLRDLYEVSCAELDAMVSAAQGLAGCYGARLTGAGFGGCAVALVDAGAADDFKRELAARYEAATGLTPEIGDLRVCCICRGGDCTARVKIPFVL
jgi:galactokinase